MPTTILDNESPQESLQRRYAEEARIEERMTTKLEQAARQALGALVRAEAMYGQPNADIQTALRSALADSAAFSSEALSEPPTTEELIQHRYEDHQLNGEAK